MLKWIFVLNKPQHELLGLQHSNVSTLAFGSINALFRSAINKGNSGPAVTFSVTMGAGEAAQM